MRPRYVVLDRVEVDRLLSKFQRLPEGAHGLDILAAFVLHHARVVHQNEIAGPW